MERVGSGYTLHISDIFLRKNGVPLKDIYQYPKDGVTTIKKEEFNGKTCMVCNNEGPGDRSRVNELIKVFSCHCQTYVCSIECYNSKLICPSCKSQSQVIETFPFVYETADAFINFMESIGRPIDGDGRTKGKSEHGGLFMLDEGVWPAVPGMDGTTLAGVITMQQLGTLDARSVVLEDMRIERLKAFMTYEELKQEIEILFNTDMEFMWCEDTMLRIDSHLVFPYLPRIKFPDIMKLSIGIDISPEELGENEIIKLGQFRHLVIWKRSLLIIPRIILEGGGTARVEVNPLDTPVDLEAIKEIEMISLGKVGEMSLHDKAINILPKINFEGLNEVEKLSLNLSEAYLNHHAIEEMNITEAIKVKSLFLMDRAFDIMAKVKIEADQVMIDTLDSTLDIQRIKGMDNMNFGSIKKLRLNREGVHLLPKISFGDGCELKELVLETKESDIDLQEIQNMEDINLDFKRICYIAMGNKALYILPKIKIGTDCVIERLEINTLELDLDHKAIEGMESISLGKVIFLVLQNKALYLLPSISSGKYIEIDNLVMDTANSEIDHQEIQKMDRIILRKIQTVAFYNKSVYILPRIGFSRENVINLVEINTFETDIYNGQIKTTEKIHLGKVNRIIISNSALYSLPKIQTERGFPTESITIDTFDSDIDQEILNRMDMIDLGRVDTLYLANKAFYLLSRIKFEPRDFISINSGEVDADIERIKDTDKISIKGIYIHPKDSDIDHERIREMDRISIKGAMCLFFFGSAFYLLPRMVFERGNGALAISINTLDSDIDHERVEEMEMINLGVLGEVGLYHKAFYLLPKIGFTEDNEVTIIDIDTLESEVDHDRIRGMETTSLEGVNRININNSGVYLLPRIRSGSNSGFENITINTQELEIDHEGIREMDAINLGKLNELVLNNKALYILPKIMAEGENDIDTIQIDTLESEIDHERIREMDRISLRRVSTLSLINNAVYLLPRITVDDGSYNPKLKIDTKNSEIDHERITEMGAISLRNVTSLYLYSTALYFLSRIQCEKAYMVEVLEINTLDCEIDQERIDGMGIVNLGFVSALMIYNKALYILPKMRFDGENILERVHINTLDSEIDCKVINQMGEVSLGLTANIGLYNRALYILPKITFEEDSTMETMFINTLESDVDLEGIKEMGYVILRSVTQLLLYNKALYIFPRMIFERESYSVKLQFDTFESEIDNEAIRDMHMTSISRVNYLTFYNRSVYLLPRIKFEDYSEVSSMYMNIVEEYVSHEAIKTMEQANLGDLRELIVLKNALYFLPRMTFDKDNVIEHIVIDTEDSILDPGKTKEMDIIHLGKVGVIEIHNDSFCILPKIVFEKEHAIEKIVIDARSSNFDMNEIGSINLGKVKEIEFYNRAFYLLYKITFATSYSIEQLMIDISDPNIDTMDGINEISISSVDNLILKNKATKLFPIMKFPGDHMLQMLSLISDKSRFPSKSEIKKTHKHLKNINMIVLCRALGEFRGSFPKSIDVHVTDF
eukprot:GHVP01011576.1.p1 GENE.GHVP01011576.1~~GHVP01011576.1.p1  ORF type:complete len:1533 (+),score=197.16 GHVP01011576.1:111-4601(+)